MESIKSWSDGPSIRKEKAKREWVTLHVGYGQPSAVCVSVWDMAENVKNDGNEVVDGTSERLDRVWVTPSQATRSVSRSLSVALVYLRCCATLMDSFLQLF